MPVIEGRTNELCMKLETLSAKVALLKDRLAEQTYSVKLEHYWELEKIRTCFGEFKWRVEQLEGDDDSEMQRHELVLETTWAELVAAIDLLLAVLPEKYVTKNGSHAHQMLGKARQNFLLQSGA